MKFRTHRARFALTSLLAFVATAAGCAESSDDAPAQAGDAGSDANNASSGAPAPGTPAPTSSSGSHSSSSGAPSPEAEAQWAPLTLLPVVDPMDHGAIGDGQADDTQALRDSIDTLPSGGGIVYFPADKSFLKTDVVAYSKAHVKLWSPNGQATVLAHVRGQARHQSFLCRDTTGCGFFGLKLTSDATRRYDALEDNQITVAHSSDSEIVGNEITGSAATGLFLYGAERLTIEGNYIHHTWADHIHHTDGTRASWCWDNAIFNEAPSNGDDGIACVTYGVGSPRCGHMEWWNNKMFGQGWGRGYAVIGGDDISIHHNWAIGAAGAGIIVASEGSYDTASSFAITARDNYVVRAGYKIGHAGILLSGGSDTAGPLDQITFQRNTSVDTIGGEAFRAEGYYTNLVNEELSDRAVDLPAEPQLSSARARDTSTLRTRDTSFAPEATRRGLSRIHVRRAPGGDGFQQRLEYVWRGPATAIDALLAARTGAGDAVVERRAVGAEVYAILLSRAPVQAPETVSGVSFEELRSGDRDGSITWLWNALDVGAY